MKRKAMMKALEEKFGFTVATREEFDGCEEKSDGGIWVKSSEETTIEGLRAFNYYAFDIDPKEEVYIMGVHKKVHNFLEKHGWYAEPYDAGTYMIYN
jgi:hypothetical protein